jgi:hypothetical protein
MIRRLALIFSLLLPLCIPAAVTAAGDGIQVIATGVQVEFPSRAVFTVEVESSASIIDARLHYRVDKMNYAEVISEGWANFSPAGKIEASWAWDMRQASLPPGAEVTYWWAVKDADGNRLETAPEVMHFDDHRFVWRSLTGVTPDDGGLTLYWYQGSDSFAQELVSVCEQGLARLVEDIGAYPERPIKIYVYASASDLQAGMVFPQEWTGGVAFTEFSIIAIGISPARLDWGKRALVHELTHLVVHQAVFSPYGQLPTWLDEGLAMYNEGELEPHFQSRLQTAIREGELISVRSLCSPFSAQTDIAYVSYAQSYSLVEYLLNSYGQDSMLELLTLFKQGSTYDDALIEVYGFDIDGLDARWRAGLTSSSALAGDLPAGAWQAAAWRSHPALIAVLVALALWGALALRRRLRLNAARRSNGAGGLDE